MRFGWIVLVVSVVFANSGLAGVVSLLDQAGLGSPRGGLFAVPQNDVPHRSASLFVGKAKGGFFADRPAHVPVYAKATGEGLQGDDVTQIRDLIGQAESRRDGYDAVQHGARIKPGKRPSQMTIAEIYQWIADTPGQPHAIGRYQFIPKTLVRVVEKTGVDTRERFTPAVQDQLADVLLAEAGLHQFRKGALGRTAFMDNLAKIWAGLPNSSGKSHYDGYAGNSASISWARFEAVMTGIAPG